MRLVEVCFVLIACSTLASCAPKLLFISLDSNNTFPVKEVCANSFAFPETALFSNSRSAVSNSVSFVVLSVFDQSTGQFSDPVLFPLDNGMDLPAMFGNCDMVLSSYNSKTGLFNNDVATWAVDHPQILGTLAANVQLFSVFYDTNDHWITWSHNLPAGKEHLTTFSSDSFQFLRDTPISFIVTAQTFYESVSDSIYSVLYDLGAPMNNRSLVLYSANLGTGKEYKSKLVSNTSFEVYYHYHMVPDGVNGNLAYFVFEGGSTAVSSFYCSPDRSQCYISSPLFTIDAPPQQYVRKADMLYDPAARELYIVFNKRGVDNSWELRVYNTNGRSGTAVRRFSLPVKGGALYSFNFCDYSVPRDSIDSKSDRNIF